MMHNAMLYIVIGQGKFIQGLGIHIEPDSPGLTFDQNAQIREVYLQAKCEKLRIMFLKQIVKFQYDYHYVIATKAFVIKKYHRTEEEDADYYQEPEPEIVD